VLGQHRANAASGKTDYWHFAEDPGTSRAVTGKFVDLYCGMHAFMQLVPIDDDIVRGLESMVMTNRVKHNDAACEAIAPKCIPISRPIKIHKPTVYQFNANGFDLATLLVGPVVYIPAHGIKVIHNIDRKTNSAYHSLGVDEFLVIPPDLLCQKSIDPNDYDPAMMLRITDCLALGLHFTVGTFHKFWVNDINAGLHFIKVIAKRANGGLGLSASLKLNKELLEEYPIPAPFSGPIDTSEGATIKKGCSLVLDLHSTSLKPQLRTHYCRTSSMTVGRSDTRPTHTCPSQFSIQRMRPR